MMHDHGKTQRMGSSASMRTSTPQRPSYGSNQDNSLFLGRSSSPEGFKLKTPSTEGSAFTREYTYSADSSADQSRRPFSPRQHGFNYAANSPRSTAEGQSKDDEATSPTSKKLTGLAFTYNPPTVEGIRPTTVTTPSQPPPTSFSTPAISSLARKSPTAASKTSVSPRPSPVTRKSMGEARKAFLEEAVPSNTSATLPSQPSPKPPLSTGILPPKSPRGILVQSKTFPSPSPRPVSELIVSGRASRQSKESALESDSSSVTSDSDSMVNEYEKDDPRPETIVASVTSAKSAFFSDQQQQSPSLSLMKLIPPAKPKLPSVPPPTSRPWGGYGMDRVSSSAAAATAKKLDDAKSKPATPSTFSSLTRKRLVQNADGSIIEAQSDTIEPSLQTSSIKPYGTSTTTPSYTPYTPSVIKPYGTSGTTTSSISPSLSRPFGAAAATIVSSSPVSPRFQSVFYFCSGFD